VRARATRSRHAAAQADGRRAIDLAGRAEVEEAHVDLWREFALGAGWCAEVAWCYAVDPLPETSVCARTWAGAREQPLAEHLVALYAIEAPRAAIAATELDGLLDHYGFSASAHTEYHRIHAGADQASDVARAAFDELRKCMDPVRLLSRAEEIHHTH